MVTNNPKIELVFENSWIYTLQNLNVIDDDKICQWKLFSIKLYNI